MTAILDGVGPSTAIYDATTDIEVSIDALVPSTPVQLTCGQFPDDGPFLGIVAFTPPADFDTYANQFATGGGENPVSLTIIHGDEHRGGSFVRVCAADLEVPKFGYCEVNWLGPDLVITIFLSAEAVDTHDLDALEGGLVDQLDALLTALAASSPG